MGLTASLSSVLSRSGGSEQDEGFSSLACAETSLLLARRPSFFTDAAGVIPAASGTTPSVTWPRGQRPRPQSPRCTYGVVAARQPPMNQNGPTLHVPQPLLHWVRSVRASLALYVLRCGVANGAGPWRCTAGVTPASTRTRERWTEARTGPGPPVPPQWQTTTHYPGNLRRHSELASTKTR